MKGVRVTSMVKKPRASSKASDLGRVKMKKTFPEIISHKIFETKSSFDVK